MDAAEDLEGKRVADRFDVGEIIAMGGMGTVYRATQIGLGRPVALKVLRQHSSWDRDTVQRFHREAKTMSLLVHPNTVRVIEFGETTDGLLFLAMEYLEGRTLSQAIRERELGVPDAVHIAAQILSSLKEAHDKGVIHRDLKPDNIFLAEDPTSDEPMVKVLDFGIAKVVGAELSFDALETQAGTVFGTPKYMSPEQAQGHELDGRSDLYAVGALLYAMLTGSPPFDDADAVVVMAHHIREKVVSPRERVPDAPIPPALDRVVMKALAKQPQQRYKDASEFLDALADASPAVMALASANRVTRALDRAWRQPKVRRAGFRGVAIGAASLVAVALATQLALRSGDSAHALDAGTQLVDAARAPSAVASAPDVSDDEAGAAPDGAPTTQVTATLLSEPAGAEVWSDGVLIGTTPLVTPLAAGAAMEVELRLAGFAATQHLFAAIEAPQRVRLTRARRRPAPSAGATERPSSAMRATGSAYERFD
ncbi:MAG: serine/threonine protein kinase [Sandaracinaceae bacterium]|nr:serine/threonine protein kinase [Myxococcales bacterium]MCB9662349.1 serine/threonine protein kinase [Sandaracinaceae bacterium]